MNNAFLRLFLIFFPFLPFLIAILLSKNSLKTNQHPNLKTKSFFETQCPPLIGVSPLFLEKTSLKRKPINFAQNHSYPHLISEKDFFKQISSMKTHLKQNNIPSHHLLITLPLYLTKDNHWLISKKSFIFSQNLERIEISHLNYKELQQSFMDVYKLKPLSLNAILRKYPKTKLLLKLEGKNNKKIQEQLNLLITHQNSIYLTSPHEKLLKQISQSHPKILLLHSFKKIIRFQILNTLQIKSFMNFPGDGILIPLSLSPSKKIISHIKNLKKLLILEENISSEIPKSLAKSINGLVSSNFQTSLAFIEHKKPCFLK